MREGLSELLAENSLGRPELHHSQVGRVNAFRICCGHVPGVP